MNFAILHLEQEQKKQLVEQEKQEKERLARLRRQNWKNSGKMSLKNLITAIITTTHPHNTHLNAKKRGF